MNEKEKEIEGRKILAEYCRKRMEIETQAKKEGVWSTIGLDANNHLFKELINETKFKLNKLNIDFE